ncbi:VWA domain-containing protein [Effusibacillus pohliae]|uniref:VWA domain-containing protein n=1 Tax=Effusibacillus pohliae TaxID=232270 RepID=UPI000379FA75|nr:VWA domain-containing protein [Effusibacillus pohliae]
MKLLSPWMLSFLVTLPLIVLLYLLKRTYEPRTVPSILLWQKFLREMEANRPWQKLRRNILLLLQLLAALIFAVALARPAINGSGPLATHTIAVLDLSASMAAQSDGQTQLEKSKKQLQEWIGQLAPNQRMTLIAMAKEARILAAGHDHAELQKAVRDAQQEYGKADYEGALSLAAALSGKDPASSVLIFSDGNWGLDPQLYPRFARQPQMIMPDRNLQNVGISHAAAAVQADRAELVATVRNYNEQASSAEVQLYDEAGKLLEAMEVALPANGKQDLFWRNLPVGEFYRVSLKNGDALEFDNERIVLPLKSGSAKAWMTGNGNLFLEKALKIGSNLTVERGTDSDAAPSSANLYVYDGVLPDRWPNGSVLLVNPPAGAGIVKTGDLLEPGKLQIVDSQSPLLQYVELDRLHLKAVRQVESVSWLKPIAYSGNTPLLLTGELNGRRIAILPFDLHQSDLPLLPAFPILVKHLKDYLLPSGGNLLGQATVGERVALLPPIREEEWSVTDPYGKSHKVEKSMIEQGFVPESPGLYRFQSHDKREVKLLAVSSPVEESNVTPVKVALPSGSEQAEGEQQNAQQKLGQTEIWRYFALALLFLLYVEWGVYKRGY